MRHSGFCGFGVFFGCFFVGLGWVCWFGVGCWLVFACFRHAGVLACFQCFWLVVLGRVCIWLGFSVSLSLAAQRGWFSSFGWLMGRLVWWWFENSRACLYYLLVNYCQFIVSLTDCRVPERVVK